MALPVNDTFLQTTGSAQQLATYNSNFTIVNGALIVNHNSGDVRANQSDTVNVARWNADTFNAAHWSKVTFGWNGTGNYLGPCVGIQTGAHSQYRLDTNGSDNYIQRCNAGSDTLLGAQPSHTFTAGDIILLEISYPDGSTTRITLKSAPAGDPTNFTTIATRDDTSGSRFTSGSAGFWGYSDGQGAAGIPFWEAGNLGSSVAIASLMRYYKRRRM